MRNSDKASIPATANFAFGYLLAWLAFSCLAVMLQWLTESWGLLDSMMMWSTNYALSTTLLIVASLYQFTTLKAVCLRQCRAPAEFISNHWKLGALRMGIKHGLLCAGCCWSLMALLFVGGAMNLVWIAGSSFFVLVEKLYPSVKSIVYISGVILVSAGLFLLLKNLDQ